MLFEIFFVSLWCKQKNLKNLQKVTAMAKLAIKSDNQNQIMLFPPSLDELIPSNHVVRIVSTVIDRLDISEIMSTYKGGGNSCFDPSLSEILIREKFSVRSSPLRSMVCSPVMTTFCTLSRISSLTMPSASRTIRPAAVVIARNFRKRRLYVRPQVHVPHEDHKSIRPRGA